MRTAQPSPAAAAEALAPVLRGPVVDGRVVAVLGMAVYLECPRGLVAVLAPGAVSVPVGLRPADGVLPTVVVGDVASVGDGQVWLHPHREVRPGTGNRPGWAVRRWWPSSARPRAGLPATAAVTALQARLPALPPTVAARVPMATGSAASRSAARALVGLGEGLTPLGDDVLAGLLVAWSAWPEAAAGRRPTLARAVTALLSRTTPISAALLHQAVAGHAATPLLAVVEALTAGGDAEIDCATTGLLAIGHTSGLGLGHGLVWGLTGATSKLGSVA